MRKPSLNQGSGTDENQLAVAVFVKRRGQHHPDIAFLTVACSGIVESPAAKGPAGAGPVSLMERQRPWPKSAGALPICKKKAAS